MVSGAPAPSSSTSNIAPTSVAPSNAAPSIAASAGTTAAPSAEAPTSTQRMLTLRNDSDRPRTFVVYQKPPSDSGAQALAWQVRTVGPGASAVVQWKEQDWSASLEPVSRSIDGNRVKPGSFYLPMYQMDMTASNFGNFRVNGPATNPTLWDSTPTNEPITIRTTVAPLLAVIGVDKAGASMWVRPAQDATTYRFNIAESTDYFVAAADVEQRHVLDDETVKSGQPVRFQGTQMKATLRGDGSWTVTPGS
jgi:hypothetical protein